MGSPLTQVSRIFKDRVQTPSHVSVCKQSASSGLKGARGAVSFRVRPPHMVPIKEEAVGYLHGRFTGALSYTYQDINIIFLESLLFFSWTCSLISKSTLSNWLLRLSLAFS